MESSKNINENADVEAQKSTSESSEVGTLANPSATGANPDLPGFTQENLDEHWESHKKEYPNLTKEEYAQRALDLARSPAGATILGFKGKNGSVARFDKNAGDFVQGFNTGIATMFKLRGGENRFNKKKQRAEVDS
ncbi:MAG: hypothetical protein FWC70_07710 [Defluviitaleaceae bacterium]|nr:hypothetical protein [Defluviitaleaceae bacterium]